MGDVLALTETVCPVCLRKVAGVRTTAGDEVAIEGDCPEHGPWRTPIWRGPPSLAEWAPSAATGGLEGGCRPARGLPGADRSAGEPDDHQNGAAECPTGCGLCADHQQSTCTAVVEVTRRCNLRCPVCFAECSADVQTADPGVDSLRSLLRELFVTSGPVNVQLSGGEPTMRDDLPAVVAAAVQCRVHVPAGQHQRSAPGRRTRVRRGAARRRTRFGLHAVRRTGRTHVAEHPRAAPARREAPRHRAVRWGRPGGRARADRGARGERRRVGRHPSLRGRVVPDGAGGALPADDAGGPLSGGRGGPTHAA